jgi:hypothetical protein
LKPEGLNVKNLSTPLKISLSIMGVLAILAVRHIAPGTFTASAGTAKAKPQNSIPSCNGDSAPSSPGHTAPSGSSKPHSVALSWNASLPISNSPADAIKGYYVYRSLTSQQYADTDRMSLLPLIGTQCVDTTVAPRTTYYYVVKAVTESGKQSLVSSEIKAVVPFP